MNNWFTRPTATGAGWPDDQLPGRADSLALATRACCCPARPVVTVVMPPTPDRPNQVDLLLCGHHYQVSRAVLQAAGAAVYDRTGALIQGGWIPGQRQAQHVAAEAVRP